jgi:hypothetical protein
MRSSHFCSLAASFLLCAAGLTSVGCGNSSATATITASWTLVQASNPNPSMAPIETCEQTGVATVRINPSPAGLFDFPCVGYMGTTPSVPAGYYQVQVIAFGQDGKVLATMEFQDVYAFGPTNLGMIRLGIP